MTDAVQLAFSLAFIGSACAPTLCVLAPACVAYVLTQRLYAAPSRDLDRLTAVGRSPTVALFKETLTGTPFIRAARLEATFEAECGHRVIMATRPLYMLYYVSETSAIMMDVISLAVLVRVLSSPFSLRPCVRASGCGGVRVVHDAVTGTERIARYGSELRTLGSAFGAP